MFTHTSGWWCTWSIPCTECVFDVQSSIPRKWECFEVFISFRSWGSVRKCAYLIMSLVFLVSDARDFATTHLQTAESAEYGTCSFSLNGGCTRCNCHLQKIPKRCVRTVPKCLSCEHIIITES